MNISIHKFFTKLEPLYNKLLPNLLFINENLSTWSDHSGKIMTNARESSKVIAGRFSMIGRCSWKHWRTISTFSMQIPNLFITKLTFAKYNEVNEVYRKLMKMNI